jgi:predicted HicB family RNase H-like nuclease
MFDPKKPEYVNKTFRLSAELIKKLESIAQTKEMSLNAIVAQCCEYAINNYNGVRK